MYRLTVDMSPYTPLPKGKNPTSRFRSLRMERTPESSARLSSVIDQLSLLSHELSLNLGETQCKRIPGEVAKPRPETVPENISLRRRIFKNRDNHLQPSRDSV